MNNQKLNIKKSILNALRLNLCGCKSSKMINNNNKDYEFVSYQPINVSPANSIEIKRSNKLIKQNGQTNLQPINCFGNELNEMTCDELNFNNETSTNRFHSTKIDNLKDTQLNFHETVQEEEQNEELDEETYNRYVLITTQLEENQQEDIQPINENESLYDNYLDQVDYDLIFKSISLKQRNMKLTSTIIKQQTKMLNKNGYQTAMPINNKQQQQQQQPQRESTRFTNNYDSTFSTANSTFEQTYYSRYSTINSSCETTLSTNSSSFSSDDSSFDFSQQFNFESTRNNQISKITNNDQENVLICVSEYKAKLSGDLNLFLNDKVKIIYNNINKLPATTNNFVLVQLIETSNKYQQENLGQYGFVPSKCIRNL